MAWQAGGQGFDQGEFVGTDQHGNVYVAGYFTQSATFSSKSLTSPAGGVTIFIAKYNPAGEIQWVQRPTATNSSSIGGMAVDANGNVYITGSFRGRITFGTVILNSRGGADLYILKLNSNGEAQWGRNEGGSTDSPDISENGTGIAVDEAGNIYVTGYYFGSTTLGPTTLISSGGSDVFVMKCNSNGDVQWAQKAGGIGGDEGGDIAVDKNGTIYITGFYSFTASFGSITLPEIGVSGDPTIFIAKYSSTGEILWAQRGEYGSGVGIAVDANGNAYVTGSLKIGRFDSYIYFAKYNTNGENQWSKIIGSIGINNGGKDIALDKAGNVYLTGFSSASQLAFSHYPFPPSGEPGTAIRVVHYGSDDVFVGKFDSNGNLIWARSGGGTGTDVGNGIAVDESGNLYVTGSFNGTATFGTTTLTTMGGRDIFVARYRQ
jgi:hypothetical protein